MKGDNYIDEINPKEAIVIRKSKATFFILPLLGQPSYWYYGLMNCYLGDEINKPELTLNKIFIQVKSYDNKLNGIPYFNQFYKLEDNTYMYVFNIPDKFVDDYERFCKGEYSKMSETAKQLICKLSGVKPIMNSTVYKVLYKTLDQKNKVEQLIGQVLPDSAELYSIPNMESELYNTSLRIATDKKMKFREDKEVEREEVLQVSK